MERVAGVPSRLESSRHRLHGAANSLGVNRHTRVSARMPLKHKQNLGRKSSICLRIQTRNQRSPLHPVAPTSDRAPSVKRGTDNDL